MESFLAGSTTPPPPPRSCMLTAPPGTGTPMVSCNVPTRQLLPASQHSSPPALYLPAAAPRDNGDAATQDTHQDWLTTLPCQMLARIIALLSPQNRFQAACVNTRLRAACQNHEGKLARA